MTTLPATDAAKAIRKDLKKAFPGVEFRVKKAPDFSLSRYATDKISITWFGEPSLEEVNEIVSKHYDTDYVHFYRY